MGIDSTCLELILRSQKYVTKRTTVLTLGRQGIHTPPTVVDSLLDKYDLPYLKGRYVWGWSEPLFEGLGFTTTDSLDYSAYEGASRIHNMNTALVAPVKRYDYIYDGGTIEHVFNTPQVCENIIDSLEVGGIFCSVTCNNNLSGHGIYQFSPEFFLSAFNRKYGMEVLELYIGIVGTEREAWIDVNSFNEQNGGRQSAKFPNSTRDVYIITIARKISDERQSLITNSPNQYSYEHGDWLNTASS
jgi:hypothetical protein